jgi:hypothetical protein
MKSVTFILALAAFILFSFSACAKKKKVAEGTPESEIVTIPKPDTEKVIVDEGFIAPQSNGRFNVESMDINGSILE